MRRGRPIPLIRRGDCPRCERRDAVTQRGQLRAPGTYQLDGGATEPPTIREDAFGPCAVCGHRDRRPWSVDEERHLITTSGLWAEEDFARWS